MQGVSTRSVDDLVKAMGMTGISKSQVSRLCAEIDERVKAFLDRPIEGSWPYLWIDAGVEYPRGFTCRCHGSCRTGYRWAPCRMAHGLVRAPRQPLSCFDVMIVRSPSTAASRLA